MEAESVNISVYIASATHLQEHFVEYLVEFANNQNTEKGHE